MRGLRPCDRHSQAPQGGPNKDSPPGLRPAPRALLRVGRAAPRPPGLRPCALTRTGTRCLSPSRRASAAQAEGRRAVRASGKFQKGPAGSKRGGSGGRAPPGREAVGNPAQAVGGQGAAAGCARRPRTGRGCPRTTGLRGRAFEAVWLSLLKTRIKSAWPES